MTKPQKVLQFFENNKLIMGMDLKLSKDGSVVIIPKPNKKGAHITFHKSGITNLSSKISGYYNVNFRDLASKQDIIGPFKKRTVPLQNIKQMYVFPRIKTDVNNTIIQLTNIKDKLEQSVIIHSIRNSTRLKRLQNRYFPTEYVIYYIDKQGRLLIPLDKNFGIIFDNQLIVEMENSEFIKVLSILSAH